MLASKCCQVDYVRPANGRFAITSDQIIKHVTQKTKLVAVMLANNETGAIQPAEKIGEEILRLKNSGFQTKYLVGKDETFFILE
jgi:cysteine sulfinate desulfinase/cysteine desulfurase-like protein